MAAPASQHRGTPSGLEASLGSRHVGHRDNLNNSLLSQGFVLEEASGTGTVGAQGLQESLQWPLRVPESAGCRDLLMTSFL